MQSTTTNINTIYLQLVLHLSSSQCDQKKLPNVNKSCVNVISLEKLKILTPLQKLP